MLVARVIQGGGGAIFPLAFSIIRDEFPRERVAGAIGLISALIGVGAGVAIVDRRADRRAPLDPLALLDPGRHDRDRARRDHLLGPESPIKAPGRINPLAVLTLSAGSSACSWESAKAASGAGRRRASSASSPLPSSSSSPGS